MQNTTSFLEYIKARRITDTPNGDFVSDAKRDKNLPDVKSWEELRSYLRGKTRHPEVFSAARSVWRQYQRQMGKA